MNRIMLVSSVLLIACFGCASTPTSGFGPFPTSSIAGGNLAGVAGFASDSAAGVEEFTIRVLNTDSTVTYDVSVTPNGGTATTKTVISCNTSSFVASCIASSVELQATGTGLASPVTLSITPPANCAEQLVFIAVTTTGNTKTVTLTQTAPESLANCGL